MILTPDVKARPLTLLVAVTSPSYPLGDQEESKRSEENESYQGICHINL